MREFAKIEENDSMISVGSIVTMTELIESEIIKKYFHSIYQSAYHLGSEQIRNLATIGEILPMHLNQQMYYLHSTV